MCLDLIIRNGRFILPEKIVRGELAAENGQIQKIAVSGLPKGEREIDAKNRIIMPGVIDAHVHFYDEKFLNREDFTSGTSAAAVGGVTTVIIMPWDTPVISRSSIEKLINEGQQSSIVDFALHAGNMTAESVNKVPEINSLGIKSFKVFTCEPYRMTYDSIEKLMKSVKAVNGVTFVHAEDDEILRNAVEKILKKNRKDPLAHADSRPNEAEEKATKKITELSERTGCRVHFAHITTRQGCDVIKKAKKRRIPVSAETCTHFLVFTRRDISRLGPYLKVNPSLKTNRDRAALWEALDGETIDIVTSDHAPSSKEEKEVGWKNIWDAPSGVPSVETLLPIMLGEGVSKRKITLERIANVLCTKPAQLFGIYPRKGVIQKGADADLVMLDLKKEVTISAERLHYKVGWTPYDGMKVRGTPTMTIVRGSIVAEEGEILGSPGYGQFLAR